jgi:predicted PurR-regulated permease PerM
MSKATVGAGWQRAIVTLTATVVGVVVIGTLYWAQSVFIPVALAGFLTFLLSPLVSRLRQIGMPRTPSVIAAVLLTAAVLGGISWLVTEQISSLLRELPKYRQTVKDKVRTIKEVTGGTSNLQEMITDINKELGGNPSPRPIGGEPAADGGEGAEALSQAPAAPTAVVIEPQRAAWMSRISSFLSPMLEYLGELALAIILVIFMLLKREELRNRIIRLAGHGKIVAATKFVDEAAHRVSRFLLMQAIVNASFGLLFGVGLLVIGVKYALLWGFLGAMLRYLPYIGPYLAVTFPISLSVAMSEGWGSTLAVIGLFLTLELIISNVIEPRLYGHSMGVSEIAMLVSAAFWAFLWGPIGLVLSSPLTVCLVVLGRYIPQLEFLSVLLGDEPALDAAISFYQRLLARDQDEAEGLIIEEMGRLESPEQIFDAMLLPSLGAIKRNRVTGDITVDDEQYALQAIREIVEDIGEGRIVAAGAHTEAEAGAQQPPPADPPIKVFGCPAHDAEDQAAAEMLRYVLDPARWDVEVIAPATLTGELLDRVAEHRPGAVVIATTPPGGLAHTRYLCKRLRSRFPDLKIVVGRWGTHDITTTEPSREAGPDRTAEALKAATADPATAGPAPADPMIAGLKEAGADFVAATLLETRQQLASLIPVLVQGPDGRDLAVADGPRPAGNGRRAGRTADLEVAAGAPRS